MNEDKGSKMLCKTCETEWWTGPAGKSCPVCDPRLKRLESTIRFNLDSKRTERVQLNAKIDVLEDLVAMAERLERGL